MGGRASSQDEAKAEPYKVARLVRKAGDKSPLPPHFQSLTFFDKVTLAPSLVHGDEALLFVHRGTLTTRELLRPVLKCVLLGRISTPCGAGERSPGSGGGGDSKAAPLRFETVVATRFRKVRAALEDPADIWAVDDATGAIRKLDLQLLWDLPLPHELGSDLLPYDGHPFLAEFARPRSALGSGKSPAAGGDSSLEPLPAADSKSPASSASEMKQGQAPQRAASWTDSRPGRALIETLMRTACLPAPLLSLVIGYAGCELDFQLPPCWLVLRGGRIGIYSPELPDEKGQGTVSSRSGVAADGKAAAAEAASTSDAGGTLRLAPADVGLKELMRVHDSEYRDPMRSAEVLRATFYPMVSPSLDWLVATLAPRADTRYAPWSDAPTSYLAVSHWVLHVPSGRHTTLESWYHQQISLRAVPWFAYDESALHCFSADTDRATPQTARADAKQASGLRVETTSSHPAFVLRLQLALAAAAAASGSASAPADDGIQPLNFDAAAAPGGDRLAKLWGGLPSQPAPAPRPNHARWGGQLRLLDYMCATAKQREARTVPDGFSLVLREQPEWPSYV